METEQNKLQAKLNFLEYSHNFFSWQLHFICCHTEKNINLGTSGL